MEAILFSLIVPQPSMCFDLSFISVVQAMLVEFLLRVLAPRIVDWGFYWIGGFIAGSIPQTSLKAFIGTS